VRAVIYGGGGGGGGGGSARFVEAVVCGDSNTLRLLSELLCSGDLADPAAAALIGAVLCFALHRRPATVGPTRQYRYCHLPNRYPISHIDIQDDHIDMVTISISHNPYR